MSINIPKFYSYAASIFFSSFHLLSVIATAAAATYTEN